MEENKQEAKPANNYDVVMKKLIGIMGGAENISSKSKLDKDVFSTVVNGLLEDRKKSTEAEVKKDLTDLLEKHLQLKTEIDKKKKELITLEQQKQKEFIEAANKLFNKVEGIDEIAKSYYDSLITATNTDNTNTKTE